jgi:hypothetical protein
VMSCMLRLCQQLSGRMFEVAVLYAHHMETPATEMKTPKSSAIRLPMMTVFIPESLMCTRGKSLRSVS